MHTYVNDLRSLGVGEVLMGVNELRPYAEDASLFVVDPEVVVQPRTANDIAKLVRFVQARKDTMPSISLTPRAAGTCMSGGSLTESIVVDMTRYLNHIGSVEDCDGEKVITVEPGAYYRDFEKVAALKGYMLPSFPASKALCTVGGMLGNNSGGEYSLTYGSTERFVRELQMVLQDGTLCTFGSLTKAQLEEKKKLDTFEGEVYRNLMTLIDTNIDAITAAKPRVSKNTAGYFLWNVFDGTTYNIARLITGSQGTLGIVTKITFALVPVPVREESMIITLDTLSKLPEVTNAILAENPICLEAFDENTYALAREHMQDVADATICTPESVLTILVKFSGEHIAERIARVQVSLERIGVEQCLAATEHEAENYWKIRRASFQLLRQHSGESHRVAPFIDDIIVSPEKLGTFLPELRTLLAEYFLAYTIAGHVGNGNFHIVPLVDMRMDTERNRILELADRTFSLVFAYGGSMAGEHNDGIIRTPFVERMFGHDMYKLFIQTKDIFDPKNIFNPGKKVRGSLAYALEHFARTNKGKM